jgi:hypothetical protein
MQTQVEQSMDEGLHVYAEPLPGRKYILGIDSATGRAFDCGGVQVIDIESMDQVAELNVHQLPNDFAQALMALGYRYNTGLLVVENNAVGMAVIEHIKLAGYPNFFYCKKGTKAGDKLGESGNAAEGSMPKDFIHGVMTLGPNRSFMLSKLEEFIRTGIVRVRSPRFRAEMETFVWNGDRAEARSGKRDDLIMAMALAVWVRDNIYGGVYNTPGLAAAMMNAMKINRTQNTQVQGASKNPDHVPVRSMGTFNISTSARPHVVPLPSGRGYIDLMAEMGMYVPRRR